jgi:hypothetical protein
MDAGVIPAQFRPDDAVSVKLTVPVNPFRAVTVIVVVADVPMVTAAGDAAETAKSETE